MEDQEVTTQENLEPTGEVVTETPEQVEEPGVPATPDDDEITQLQDAVDKAESADDRAGAISRRNAAFAKMRREAQESKDAALQAIKDAEYHRGLAEARKFQDQAAPVTPAAPVPDPLAPFSQERPDEDNYESYADFEVAKENYVIARAKHEARQEAIREASQVQLRDKVAGWFKAAPMPDFEAIVCKPTEQGGAPFSREILDIVQESPVGHQLAYELAQDPQEVWRLRNLPPHLMAMELIRREQKLSVTPGQPKKISGAPAPINPVTPAATSVSKALEDLSTAEYMARRDREQFGPNWKG